MSKPILDRRLGIKEVPANLVFFLVVAWLPLPYQLKCKTIILKIMPEQLNSSIYQEIKFAKSLTAH